MQIRLDHLYKILNVETFFQLKEKEMKIKFYSNILKCFLCNQWDWLKSSFPLFW